MIEDIKFQREIDFQKSPIGKIPKDWEVAKLANVSERIKGRKPTMLLNEKTGNSQPYLIAEYMRSNSNIQWCKNDDPKIVRVDQKELIMIWDGSYSGDVFVGFEGVLASTMVKIMPAENLDRNFLYYFLKTKFKFLRGTTSGTGIPHVSKSIFENLLIPLPSVKEQRAVVGVLGVVDSAIGLVDRVIQKTERLKKGLMQTLLTRGIGHKEYEQTPIGKKPKEWNVVALGDICNQRNEMFQPSGKNDYRFVGLEHIASGETRMRTHAQDIAVKSSKFRFYSGDILYGKLRPYLDKAVLVDFDGICSTDLLVLKPQDEVLKEFLVYVLHFKEFLKHAVATTSGTNHPRTSWTAISKFRFGLPKPEEQKRIAETLLAVDKKLEVEKIEKAKLERIKQGLMDLLLTGKVRVKVD